MVTLADLKKYASKIMFDMDESEYETLMNEFEVILKQMDLISKIDNIESVEPMTFPYVLNEASMRNDECSNELDVKEAFKNTAHIVGRELSVPKVVE